MKILIAINIIVYIGIFAYLLFRQRQKEKAGIVFVYLGGYPGLKGPKRIVIQSMGDSISFQGINLPKKDVIEIKLVSRSQASNALAGAALGGIVAGPIGALVGAAATSSPGGNMIRLSYKENDIAYEIFFSDNDIINKYPLLKQMAGK